MLMRQGLSRCVRRCSGGVDIAFKPNEDGWGYNKNYGSSFDRIFGKETKKEAEKEKKPEPKTEEK